MSRKHRKLPTEQPKMYSLIHLSAWRKACRLTILHVACLTGIEEAELRALERCEIQADRRTVEALADMFGCPLEGASLYDPEYADEIPQRWAHEARVRLNTRTVKGVERVTVYADWLDNYLKPWNHREDSPTVFDLARVTGLPVARLEAIVDLAPCTFPELETIAHALGLSPLGLITQDIWE